MNVESVSMFAVEVSNFHSMNWHVRSAITVQFGRSFMLADNGVMWHSHRDHFHVSYSVVSHHVMS